MAYLSAPRRGRAPSRVGRSASLPPNVLSRTFCSACPLACRLARRVPAGGRAAFVERRTCRPHPRGATGSAPLGRPLYDVPRSRTRACNFRSSPETVHRACPAGRRQGRLRSSLVRQFAHFTFAGASAERREHRRSGKSRS
ncbi:hypothetical protein BV20DRAFT_319190 [Pilatotrama ljubarskyi]|nr:hypothetical protein BV20DRAFT_319190 [Pilatotrama ljubarskyi]